MKITRAHLGKEVRLTWRDPCRSQVEGQAEFEAAKGSKFLPRWTEYGLIDDFSDDVVRLVHSECANATPMRHASFIPADLIESLVILVPSTEAPSA